MAPATKPAPAKTPRRSRPRSPRLLRSLSWPPAADAPLTKEQKRVLATATVAAATKVLGTAAVKGLPADTTRAQIAQWMAYLPHGGQWPAALPRPPPASSPPRKGPAIPTGPGPFAYPEPGRRAPRRTPGPCSPSPRHTERPARCVQVIGWPGARVGLRPHCPCPKRCLSPRP